MKTAIIHRPYDSTLNMIKRKSYDMQIQEAIKEGKAESIGICQGSVLEIIVASDIAEKTSDVIVGEINGSCPQHMTCLVIVGKTSAVMAAVEAIKMEAK